MTARVTISKSDLKRYADVANEKGCRVVIKRGDTVVTVIPDDKRGRTDGIDYGRPIL